MTENEAEFNDCGKHRDEMAEKDAEFNDSGKHRDEMTEKDAEFNEVMEKVSLIGCGCSIILPYSG